MALLEQGALWFPIGGVYVVFLTPTPACGLEVISIKTRDCLRMQTRGPMPGVLFQNLGWVLVSLGHGFLMSCENETDRL